MSRPLLPRHVRAWTLAFGLISVAPAQDAPESARRELSGRIELSSPLPPGESLVVALKRGGHRSKHPLAELCPYGPIARAAVEPDGSFRLEYAKRHGWAHLELESSFVYLLDRWHTDDLDDVEGTIVLRAAVGGSLRVLLQPKRMLATDAGELLACKLEVSLDDPEDVFDSSPRSLPIDDGLQIVRQALPADAVYEIIPNGFHAWGMRQDGGKEVHTWQVESLSGLRLAPGTWSEWTVPVWPVYEIHGQVFDEHGKPIAGASVTAHSSKPQGSLHASSWHTDAEGRYEIDELFLPLISIEATAGGFAAQQADLRGVSWAREIKAPDLVLRPRTAGLALSGRTIRPDGTAIEGAELTLISLRSGQFGAHERASGRDGRFEFTDVEPGWWDLLAIARPSDSDAAGLPGAWASALVEGVAAGARDLEIVLASPRPVGVLVVDERGELVPGADFVFRHARSWRLDRLQQAFLGLVASDEPAWGRLDAPDGSLTHPGLLAGAWNLIGRAPGHADSDPIRIDASEVSEELRFVVRRSAPIQGVVVDPDGLPAVGASVQIRTSGGAEQSSSIDTLCDEAGRFQVDPSLLAGVDLEIRAVLEGHAPSLIAVLPIAALQRAAVELRLQRSASIACSVRSALGQPLANQRVQLEGPWTEATRDPPRTDSSGTIRFSGLAAGRYRVVLVWPVWTFLGPPSAEIDVEEGGDATLVLGELEDRTSAVDGFVRWTSVESGQPSLRAWPERSPIPSAWMECDPHGGFELVLPQGSVWFEVRHPRGGETFFVRELASDSVRDLVLELPRGSLEGRVAAGEISRAALEVLVRRSLADSGVPWIGSGSFTVPVEPDGWWWCEGLASGSYDACLRRSGIQSSTRHAGIELEEGGSVTGLDFAFSPGGAIRGTIVSEHGRWSNQYSIRARTADGALLPAASAVSHQESVFLYEGLPPGDSLLEARSWYHRQPLVAAAPQTVTVAADALAELDLALVRGTTLVVRLQGVERPPLDLRVRILDERGFDHAPVWRDDDDVPPFALERSFGPLAPGDYLVRLAWEDRSIEQRIEVHGEEGREVVLDLAR